MSEIEISVKFWYSLCKIIKRGINKIIHFSIINENWNTEIYYIIDNLKTFPFLKL